MIEAFALITLGLGSIFVYYDIKSRSVGNTLFLTMSIFAVIEISVFGVFQFGIMVIIPAIIIFLAAIISYYTGNIGIGDLPVIASILILLFNYGIAIYNLIVFSIPFIISFLLTPIILYRMVLSKREIYIAFAPVIVASILSFVNLFFGIVSFLTASCILAYIIDRNRDDMYKYAVRFLHKDKLIIGDLIETKLLDNETIAKLGITKSNNLVNINKDIMDKIDYNMVLPIYSNSIPLTIPLIIGFISVLIVLAI